MKQLVGHFFHSFKLNKQGQRKVCWQGEVIAKIDNKYYFVQLFSWLSGETTTRHMVSIKEMVNWNFYTNQEHMIEYYNNILI